MSEFNNIILPFVIIIAIGVYLIITGSKEQDIAKTHEEVKNGTIKGRIGILLIIGTVVLFIVRII